MTRMTRIARNAASASLAPPRREAERERVGRRWPLNFALIGSAASAALTVAIDSGNALAITATAGAAAAVFGFASARAARQVPPALDAEAIAAIMSAMATSQQAATAPAPPAAAHAARTAPALETLTDLRSALADGFGYPGDLARLDAELADLVLMAADSDGHPPLGVYAIDSTDLSQIMSDWRERIEAALDDEIDPPSDGTEATAHLLGNSENAARLLASVQAANEGRLTEHEPVDRSGAC